MTNYSILTTKIIILLVLTTLVLALGTAVLMLQTEINQEMAIQRTKKKKNLSVKTMLRCMLIFLMLNLWEPCVLDLVSAVISRYSWPNGILENC